MWETWDCQFIRFVLYPLLLFANKIVYPSNGPAAKLLTTLILTLVIMTITGHHMDYLILVMMI